MLRKVVVTVDEESVTKTDYINFEGPACLAEGRQFHTLLAQFGVQVEQTGMTPKPELLASLGERQELPESLETSHEREEER